MKCVLSRMSDNHAPRRQIGPLPNDVLSAERLFPSRGYGRVRKRIPRRTALLAATPPHYILQLKVNVHVRPLLVGTILFVTPWGFASVSKAPIAGLE